MRYATKLTNLAVGDMAVEISICKINDSVYGTVVNCVTPISAYGVSEDDVIEKIHRRFLEAA